MQIEIHIPRLVLIFLALVSVVGAVAWQEGRRQGQMIVVQGQAAPVVSTQRPQRVPPQGGSDGTELLAVAEAEQSVRLQREEQALLSRQEDILRFQLEELEKEIRLAPSMQAQQAIRQSAERLRQLLLDKHAREEELLQSLRQLWDAQRAAGIVSDLGAGPLLRLSWPVEPESGISAHFLDTGYRQRFGLDHQAVDIPTEQGTTVRAPADGVVEKVVDNGYGYNYLIVRHIGGVTVYGHLESFLVAEGDSVTRGDPLGLSGGRPGSPGAGNLSTGPHLHFEVIVDGEHVDPEDYLEPHL